METNILFLFLGWFLGILSPLIVDRVRRRYQIDDVKRGILTELKDTRSRLAMSAYQVAVRLGKIDRSLLTWIAPVLQEYQGTEPKEDMLRALEYQLKLTDEQLSALAGQVKFKPGGALSLKTFAVPFLDANMSLLSLFPIDFQNRILEIRAQISLLNQEIDQSTFLFWKTFDSGTTEDNQRVIRDNILSKYHNIEGASRRLADKITNLVSN